MPQVFQVIRCYSCETFQVQMTKKIHKWQCKMCNEKQSIKKVYSQGTAKDCRLHVQAFNAKRMQLDNQQLNLEQFPEHLNVTTNINAPCASKWNAFLPEQTPISEQDSYLNESYTFDSTNKKRTIKQSTTLHCKRSKQSHCSNIVDQTDCEHHIFEDEEAVDSHRNNFQSKLSDSLQQDENTTENSEIIEKKTSKWDSFIQNTGSTHENTINKNIFCNLDTNLDDLFNF